MLFFRYGLPRLLLQIEIAPPQIVTELLQIKTELAQIETGPTQIESELI